jgi:site-specific recombinase XerD
MNIQQAKQRFLEYVEIEKGRALNTVRNYEHYLDVFIRHTAIHDTSDITDEIVREFRLWLNRQPVHTKIRGEQKTMSKKNSELLFDRPSCIPKIFSTTRDKKSSCRSY